MANTPFTHVRTVSHSVNGAVVVSAQSTQSGSEETDLDLSVAASTTNGSYTLNLTQANLKSVMIYADSAVTLKTNSSSVPQETITLAAGQVIDWMTGDSAVCPFSGNVTALFITNAGTGAANVKLRCLANQ